MLKKLIHKLIQKMRMRKLHICGKNVYIAGKCTLQGNIECGNDISIGSGAYFASTIAKLCIHDYVIFAPNVSIFTGNHAMDVIGKHISEVTDNDKKLSGGGYDLDVIIEAGCWIGTRAVILKGVTIGRGSVIGAGAIVTKDVPPYSIYTGVPPYNMTRRRFTDEQILEHERILRERKISIK